MKVPAGTQSGKVFRLRGKGMPDVHAPSAAGDQYVKVMIQVPTKLTVEQKKLLEQYAQLSGEDISNKSETIAEKIKSGKSRANSTQLS